jgi:transposase
MPKTPQRRTPEFKLKIAIEALKGNHTLVQLASEYNLHPKQIRRWKDQLLQEGKDIFNHKTTQKSNKPDSDKKELLHMIEQLSLELDFLKKKLGKSL